MYSKSFLGIFVCVDFLITRELTRFSADIEVRRKATNIALSMTSSRNVEDVVSFFKKQLQKTQDQDYEKVLRFQLRLFTRIGLTSSRLQNTASC
jgi:coatomer subunit beta